jgi:hypothetical protein
MLVEKHWRVHAMMFVSSICNPSCQCGYFEMIFIDLQHRLLIAKIRIAHAIRLLYDIGGVLRPRVTSP